MRSVRIIRIIRICLFRPLVQQFCRRALFVKFPRPVQAPVLEGISSKRRICKCLKHSGVIKLVLVCIESFPSSGLHVRASWRGRVVGVPLFHRWVVSVHRAAAAHVRISVFECIHTVVVSGKIPLWLERRLLDAKPADTRRRSRRLYGRSRGLPGVERSDKPTYALLLYISKRR